MYLRIITTVGKAFLLATVLFLSNKELYAQTGEISGYLPNSDYVTITFKKGIIAEIKKSEPATGAKQYISAGLIDTQVNGWAGVSFSEADLSTDKVNKITEALWKEGVTTYFPTLITIGHERMVENLKVMASATKNKNYKSATPGFFLEGPYISPDDGFRGAHNKDHIRNPSWSEFSQYIKASDNKIAMIGVAPEKEGAMHFIDQCIKNDIYVSLVHHNASASEVNEAVNRGATVSTHLGNGCANMIHRHNNPLWSQLSNDGLVPSIIGDGHHLRPEEINTFYKVKGIDNIFLVSDATKLSGMPPGIYNWAGNEVEMTESGMLKIAKLGVLAGASFPIRTGIINVMKFTGCSLEEAVTMATKTPAKVFGLEDRGEIKVGLRADFAVFSLEKDQLKVHKTYVGGQMVYAAN